MHGVARGILKTLEKYFNVFEKNIILAYVTPG